MEVDEKALDELEAMYASDEDDKKKKKNKTQKEKPAKKGGKTSSKSVEVVSNVDSKPEDANDQVTKPAKTGKDNKKSKAKEGQKKSTNANLGLNDVTVGDKVDVSVEGFKSSVAASSADNQDVAAVGDETQSKVNNVESQDNEAVADGEDATDKMPEMSAAKRKKLKKKEKEKEKKVKGSVEEKEKSADGTGEKKKTSAMAKLIKAQLERQKEEELRLQREEEEAERKREEARLAREEKERLEKERKERKKQKEKERKARLKAEGRLLTDKQKKDKQRVIQMLEHIQLDDEQAVPIPGDQQKTEDIKKKPKYERLKRRPQPQQQSEDNAPIVETVKDEAEKSKEGAEEEGGLGTWEDAANDTWTNMEAKDNWEDEEEASDESDKESNSSDRSGSMSSATESDEDEEDSDSSDDDDDVAADPLEKARLRIEQRRINALRNKNVEVLRSALVCVLGHVDTGKTSILDKLRRTHVQDSEAGGITQQIGATNVPADAIIKATRMVKSFQAMKMLLPGLLIIDTPGHESFANLRSRGSGLCDVAILVVDLMHGIEPQTLESIRLLKSRSTPYVVALNKIDRLYNWQTNPTADIFNTLKRQSPPTIQDFKDRVQSVIAQFAMQEINVCLANENKNPDEYTSLVPTSAHSGDGMGNLLAHVCELCLRSLTDRLAYHEDLEATVMEVKEIQGLGTTLDVCLVNGRLHESETVILAGQDGPIVTQIRALLMPQPMKELRVKNPYDKFKELQGATAVKIIAKDLEKALAGLPIYASKDADEIEVYKQDVAKQLRSVLKSIEVNEIGVYVQASTLGSLEALLQFLRTEKIPFCGINIGPVHKRDVMKASIMVERDPKWAVILAFDVKVEREAQEMADTYGVKVFIADIIYHLSDAFLKWKDERAMAEREKHRQLAVFPCKLRVLPQYIFNSRDPIVCGVTVESGVLRINTPISVPGKDCIFLGRIESIERDHKKVDEARKGAELCIKIIPPPGEPPKMYGRHFDHNDLLMSRISRETIDCVKEYFRDDLTKEDWKLMVELKKAYSIV